MTFRIKMISCRVISTKKIPALKKKKELAHNAEKNKTKQKQKTHTQSSEVWGQKVLPKLNHPYHRPSVSTPQKSNGRPLFSQNSESCAGFQTRRTRSLVEKTKKENNNNNHNFLRRNLDLQGQCVCKLKKVPLFTRV